MLTSAIWPLSEWLSVISYISLSLSFVLNVNIYYVVHYQVWPVLAGLMSVPALYNSWLAMSDICGSPQSGWMPGWIMHQGGTAGEGTRRSTLPLLGFWTCDMLQNNSWKHLEMYSGMNRAHCWLQLLIISIFTFTVDCLCVKWVTCSDFPLSSVESFSVFQLSSVLSFFYNLETSLFGFTLTAFMSVVVAAGSYFQWKGSKHCYLPGATWQADEVSWT